LKWWHAVAAARRCGLVLGAHQVDAYGTGEHNYWYPVTQAVVKDKPITYYDSESKQPWQPGTSFVQRDIRALAPGEGSGRFLMDDTLPSVKITTKNGQRVVHDCAQKLQVILQAGFEGGIVKVYYGIEDQWTDHRHPLVCPKTIAPFFERYTAVRLVQGGGPHSQEYFLVYYGRQILHGDLPDAKMPFMPVGKSLDTDGEIKEVSATERTVLVNNYTTSWYWAKVSDMVTANIDMNTQVLFGTMGTGVQTYKLTRPPDNKVELQGSKGAAVQSGGAGISRHDVYEIANVDLIE